MEITFIIHLFTSIFMTGLCWFVQIVHYPLFKQIRLEDFPNYERKNYVTGFITVPVMIIELLTGLYLLYFSPSSVYFLNVGLLGIIWLSTMIYQVPIHIKITNIATTVLLNKLIRTNWIRTVTWTLRMGILGWVLLQMVHGFNNAI